jgi:hypothetical protein
MSWMLFNEGRQMNTFKIVDGIHKRQTFKNRVEDTKKQNNHIEYSI